MLIQTQLEIQLPIELLGELNCLCSLDRGCSSTKIVIVVVQPPSKQQATDKFKITFALAKNSQFDAVLDWLANTLPADPENGTRTIALTGGGSALHQEKICDKLRVQQPIFVDELVGQARGCIWLIKQAPAADVFYDDEFLTPLDEDVPLPALYVFSGSGNGLTLLYPDGSKCQDHIMMHGGKAFLGLSALVLGTSDYDEITGLAERAGPIEALDSRLGDFDMRPEHLDGLTREQKALRLASWFARWSAYFVHHGIRTSGIARVYLGCNFWRAKVLRELFAFNLRQKLLGTEFASSLKLRAFRTGHTGALGSMVTQSGKELSYIREDGFCRDVDSDY
ncbi:hypothetical protein BOX15_Mlig007788g3 [Macrostomum lignano]|uniref:Uncharacterized protein n=2 Tax=Macrostomum lignano TaxID=282301 RepID=A0A267EHZ6_9PLAT|nr:hypothetical protein BOX15_Mlig007788g3 [Macrostomum lignano]